MTSFLLISRGSTLSTFRVENGVTCETQEQAIQTFKQSKRFKVGMRIIDEPTYNRRTKEL